MDREHWQRVRSCFARAIELEDADRATFLDNLVADDPGLGRDVAALLEAHRAAETDGFLEAPAVPPGPRVAGKLEDPGPDLQVGHTLGHYAVLRLLGRGGMGAVYLAERTDQYRQRVALKVVRRGLDTEDVLRRFRLERQVLADLQHPNIARLLDGGMTGDGRPYLVMEYIDGLPIVEYCDRHRLSVDRRLALFREVCLAVHHAHRNLVVHRDLKPANILVPEDGRPRLLDFGIAKLLDADSETAGITRTRLLILSPQYASPEQVRGAPVTTATDVYGLGLVLYELLTSRPAHPLAGVGLPELERVICSEPVARPSDAIGERVADDTAAGAPAPTDVARDRATTPDRLRRKLRGDLDTITLAALRKEPERRYASAEQLSDDVRRHLEGRAVRARSDTLRYRARKFVERNAVGVVAAVLLLLVLLAGIAGTAWQAAVAAAERDRARDEAAKATMVSAFLTDLFRASDPRSNPGGDTVTVGTLLERAKERIPEIEGDDDARADLLTVLGGVYTNLGRYEDARETLGEALELREATPAVDSIPLAETLEALATANSQERAFARAEPLYRRALAIRRQRAAAAPGDTAALHRLSGTLSSLGWVLQNLGRPDTAIAMQREALRIWAQVAPDGGGSRSIGPATTRANLATALRSAGRVREAEALYRDILQRHRSGDSLSTDALASVLNNLAYLLVNREEYMEAEALYREAIHLHTETYGPGHPRTIMLMNNLAGSLTRRDRHAEVEELGRRILALQRQHRPPGHWRIATAHRSLGAIHERQGRLAEAEEEHRQALRIYEVGLGPDHAWSAYQRALLGNVLARQGRRADAEPLLLRALEQLRGSDRTDATGWSHEVAAMLADLYEAWDQPSAADRYRRLAASDRTDR